MLCVSANDRPTPHQLTYGLRGRRSAPPILVQYFPTLAALSGVPIPTDREYDGIDLTPLLMGKSETAHTCEEAMLECA